MEEHGGNLQKKDGSCCYSILFDEIAIDVLASVDNLSHCETIMFDSLFELL